MPKGLPISYIKKWGISKKAWREFRKGTLTKGVPTRTTSKYRRRVDSRKGAKGSNPRRKRSMVRRRKRRRGGKSLQKQAFKWLRIGMLAAPAIRDVLRPVPPEKKLWHIVYDYGGFDMDDGTWDIKRMATGWLPFLGACLATYGIPKIIGLIRRL